MRPPRGPSTACTTPGLTPTTDPVDERLRLPHSAAPLYRLRRSIYRSSVRENRLLVDCLGEGETEQIDHEIISFPQILTELQGTTFAQF